MDPVADLDLDALLKVRKLGEIEAARAALAQVVWPRTGRLPVDRLPDEVRPALPGEFPLRIEGQRLTVRMRHGIDSHLLYLQAPEEPTCAALVWFGHEAGETGVAELVDDLATRSCDVVVGWMPLTGPNPATVVNSDWGIFRVSIHEHFRLLEDEGFSPLAYFLEPVAAAVNHLEVVRPGIGVAMTGVSGGGWTTTVYAALDERIRLSVPVAGTLPMFLRTWRAEGGRHAEWGDWEQRHAGMLAAARYLDMYVMATSGGRRQTQVLNAADPCCFAGDGRQVVYEEAIAEAARATGGVFEVLVAEYDGHGLGDDARRRVVDLIVQLPRTSNGEDSG